MLTLLRNRGYLLLLAAWFVFGFVFGIHTMREMAWILWAGLSGLLVMAVIE